MIRSAEKGLIDIRPLLFITLKMNSFYFVVPSVRLNLKKIDRDTWTQQEGWMRGLTKEEPRNKNN